MTLYFKILEGQVSPADFTSAASAALLPNALDQRGPLPPQLSTSSSSVVALCFAMPGGRAFPANFTPAVAAALLPLALDQEGPASSEHSASSGSVVALCFAIPGGRASAPLHQKTFCRCTVLCDPRRRPRLTNIFLPPL